MKTVVSLLLQLFCIPMLCATQLATLPFSAIKLVAAISETESVIVHVAQSHKEKSIEITFSGFGFEKKVLVDRREHLGGMLASGVRLRQISAGRSSPNGREVDIDLEAGFYGELTATVSIAEDGNVAIAGFTTPKGAQPGATDNPDDAQRFREDH